MQSSKCMCMHSFMSSTYLPDSKTALRFQSFNFPPAAVADIDRNGVEFSENMQFRTQFSPSLHEFLCHFTKHSNAHTKLEFHWQHSLNPKLTLRDFIFIYFCLFSICNLNFFFASRAWFFSLSSDQKIAN